MPELPEVETIKRGLVKKILRKKIIGVEIVDGAVLDGSPGLFKRALIGNLFSGIVRRGKYLIFDVAKDKAAMLAHLRMTGQLIYRAEKDKTLAGLPNKFTRVIFTFSDGSSLYFNDIRKFGRLKILSREAQNDALAHIGIDALSPRLSFDRFRNLIAKRSGVAIKTALLDQKVVAGIGNIYADEICFLAGVRPDKKISSLSQNAIARIFKNTRTILRRSIKYRGTTFRDYRDAEGERGNFTRYLQVYGRDGEKCLRCRTGIIHKIKIAGRGTRYCSQCQK